MERAKIVKAMFDKKIQKKAKKMGRPSIYNFELMERGDSFPTKKRSALSAAIQFAARHPEFKFSSQRQSDGSWRIWRD
jgi:hypothetical protein